MCFSQQQPEPDINKPAYKPNEIRDHFKLTFGGNGAKKPPSKDKEKAPVVVPTTQMGYTK